MTDAPATGRPNVVVILADDMGFADLGCTGSEIHTPHLDALARDGVLMTQMYNAARCCPTRAALLTGRYPHEAGVGHMGADLGGPAYQGYLRSDAATIAEVLRADGYRTLMSGKWHVGGEYDALDVDAWPVGEPGHPTPRQRGFDRFYGILDGVTSFFSPHCVVEDDSRMPDLADDYYFTDAITEKAIGMIDDAVEDDSPFFLYLAHTAPHWPLHAPPEDIARYEGVYRRGWDVVRDARHATAQAFGLFETPWRLSPRDSEVSPFVDDPHPEWQASRMAVYAAMVDRMDQQVGRLVAHLRALDVLDNTLIVFLSDNGGCAEFMAEDGWAKFFPDRTHDGRRMRMGNRPDVRPGDALSYQSYDRPWANVSNTPFRLFKHYVHEGGVSTPLIAHWPAGFGPGGRVHAPAHVVDLLPTILEATGAPMLTEVAGAAAQPLSGESFLPVLRGEDWERSAPIYFEHEGNAAVRDGRFKLVRRHGHDWELYDIATDRTELDDLRSRLPGRAQQMVEAYEGWAASAGVMDWSVVLPRLLALWGVETAEG